MSYIDVYRKKYLILSTKWSSDYFHFVISTRYFPIDNVTQLFKNGLFEVCYNYLMNVLCPYN